MTTCQFVSNVNLSFLIKMETASRHFRIRDNHCTVYRIYKYIRNTAPGIIFREQDYGGDNKVKPWDNNLFS